MGGHFLVRQIYDDEITYNLVGAASKVLGEYNEQSSTYMYKTILITVGGKNLKQSCSYKTCPSPRKEGLKFYMYSICTEYSL